MAVFRKNPEKAARKAAARAEIDRLRALNVVDLAVAVFPGLGPDGPTKGASMWAQQLCGYLLAGFPGAGQTDTLDLLAPVRRAIDMLHGAGLVSPISVQREPRWQITPLGELTLADGSVRQRLTGGGDGYSAPSWPSSKRP